MFLNFGAIEEIIAQLIFLVFLILGNLGIFPG